MKKKIAILGSTGSIGENTLKIIKKDKNNFEVILLSTNRNINKVISKFFLSFLMISIKVFPIEPVDPRIAIFFFIHSDILLN